MANFREGVVGGEREREREPHCMRGMSSFGKGMRGREREREGLSMSLELLVEALGGYFWA